MLKYLKPVSKTHSIKNAQAQFFIPQSFVSVKEDFKMFQNSDLFNNFQKKGLLKPTTISINNKGLGVGKSEVSGYIFERFESDGALKDVFKLENIVENNRSVITLATRKYTRWDDFKNEQLTTVFNSLEILKPYVNAVGFTYLDEFDWVSDSKIPVNQIFNSDSELLNQKFFESNNGTLVLISQGCINNDDLTTEEKTELVFNNDLKKIQINHQYLVKLNKPKRVLKLDEAQDLGEYFDIVHKEHKKFISDLLTSECKKIINFK